MTLLQSGVFPWSFCNLTLHSPVYPNTLRTFQSWRFYIPELVVCMGTNFTPQLGKIYYQNCQSSLTTSQMQGSHFSATTKFQDFSRIFQGI